ncbi:unnamed protein product [Rhizophagus irregularis]|nr:unnamed protein product [Rhizophagus irregularis]
MLYIYTSRLFTFNNLTKPVNSSLITSYLDDEENNKDCQDSKLFDLEVSSSLQLKDIIQLCNAEQYHLYYTSMEDLDTTSLFY